MADKSDASAQNTPDSHLGRGKTLSPSDSNPPLATKVRSRDKGYLAADRPRYSYPLRGRKRQKTSTGAYRNLNDSLRRTEFKGPYVPNYEISPTLRWLQRKPISEVAKKLLVEFLRRKAFWDAVEHDYFSIEFAATTFLRVNKRRGEQIHKELTVAHGPLEWFINATIAGMNSGKIARGGATAWCPLADKFFALLSGENGINRIKTQAFGGTDAGGLVGESYEGRIDAYEGKIDDLDREILEYTICKHAKREG